MTQWGYIVAGLGIGYAVAYITGRGWEQGLKSQIVYDGEDGMVMKVSNGQTLKLDKSFESAKWLNAGRVPDNLRYDSQVKAFMRAIRAGESRQSEDAYYMLNGGQFYKRSEGFPADLTEIPHPGVIGKRGSTDASGAYQIKSGTWKAIAKLRGMEENPIMSPLNQERIALSLLAWRGALPAVLRGDLRTAYARLKNEWRCLPGAAENRLPESVFRDAFTMNGGIVADGQ